MAEWDDIPIYDDELPGADQAGLVDPGLYPEFDDSTTVYPNLEGNDPAAGFDLTPGGGIDLDQNQDFDTDPQRWWEKFGRAIVGSDKSSPRSDLFRGTGLEALGGVLTALASKPNFQKRDPFTGAVAPQKMMEEWNQGMGSLGGMLQSRPPLDFSGIQAQNPMEGM